MASCLCDSFLGPQILPPLFWNKRSWYHDSGVIFVDVDVGMTNFTLGHICSTWNINRTTYTIKGANFQCNFARIMPLV